MQLPLALAQRHYNRQLFADRYLDVTLPQRAEWLALADEATPILAALRTIFAAYTPSASEAQTEKDLVHPVLNALGHTYEIQTPLRTPKGTKKPDYIFYRDLSALQQNKGRTLSAADLAAAFAVGDAKHWERKLDVSSTSDQDEINRVPADQIAFYMRHSGVTWGLLTNGRRWRLYHRDSFERQDRYYEVDLKDLVEANDPIAFLYFYAFFRRAAFDPPQAHALTLATMLRESADYAQGVSASLKAQVYDALRHMAQGFLDYPRNKLDPTPATLEAIYANSLIVLYRLLFVLYAEARELLPLRASADYREEYSLYAVVREAARRLDSGMTLLVDTGRTWAKLRDLFGIINVGSPPLNVATFNGGLFDPQRHPFLEQYIVGDAQLQQALDKLARVADPNGVKELIDYRDLAERHLGTIYEGLLEYRLVALQAAGEKAGGTRQAAGTAGAEEATHHPSSVVRRPSSDTTQHSVLNTQYSASLPRTPADAGFTIALVNDKGERHRTGSYYTPDFVVQYIVEQTLQPILDAAVAAAPDDAAQIAAVLGVNVLDPAMGSGHFPVAAMEYIARYLVDLGVTPPAEAGDEPDLAYWKRRVAQSCIYGVDLNPLAVDLAKLSLWLATAAKGRPLSFLDHHLRCGNALVGTRVSDLDGLRLAAQKPKTRRRPARLPSSVQGEGDAPAQLSLLDDAAFAGAMSSAVGSMWLIEGSAASNVAEVKEQEQLYEQVRRSLTERFAVEADLRTAAGFGQAPEPSLWKALTAYATRREAGAFAMPAYEPLLRQLREQAAAQRFFHWDLEFPEVFFDRHGRPLGTAAGFDAVIGNPPYVRQEQLGTVKPYFQAAFAETYSGTADLFVYFLHQGVKLLQQGGRLGYIASNSWLRANYAMSLRTFMREQVTVEQLIDLGDNRVFADAPDVYPAIPIVRKTAPPADHTAQAATFSRGEGLKQFDTQVAAKLAPVSIHDQQDSGWQLGTDAGRQVFAKVMNIGKAFGEVVEGRIYRGVVTGLNEAFVIDEQTSKRIVEQDLSSAKLIKPFARGEDIRPWHKEDANQWIIMSLRGIDIELYPGVKAHLSLFRERLEPRPLNWEGLWKGRKPGSYKWHEIQDTIDYDTAFDSAKIMWPDIAKYPRFVWDEQNTRIGNTGYFTPVASPYLLGILASRVTWFVISRLSQSFGERAGSARFRLFTQSMEKLPIPDAPPTEHEAIGALAMEITAAAQARYALHQRARRRILSDLGAAGKQLNQKLTAWWELDFSAFRDEIRKVFKREIPLKERDDWEEWLSEQRRRHTEHTAAIIAGETALNAQVYQLFDLTADEISLIETSTKYKYGEV